MTTAPAFDGTQPCKTVDPEIFFPELHVEYTEDDKPIRATKEAEAEYLQKVEVAKTVCEPCPFIIPCLAYALKTPNTLGIWGGTSEQERRRIKKQKYRDKQKGTP